MDVNRAGDLFAKRFCQYRSVIGFFIVDLLFKWLLRMIFGSEPAYFSMLCISFCSPLSNLMRNFVTDLWWIRSWRPGIRFPAPSTGILDSPCFYRAWLSICRRGTSIGMRIYQDYTRAFCRHFRWPIDHQQNEYKYASRREIRKKHN